jgi:cytochrome c-type biogenesis protein CcmH/NrfG
MLRGLAYSGKGEQKAALSSYQNALKIAPDYLPAPEGAASARLSSSGGTLKL